METNIRKHILYDNKNYWNDKENDYEFYNKNLKHYKTNMQAN